MRRRVIYDPAVRTLSVALVLALASVPTMATASEPEEGSRAGVEVVHRIVWDASARQGPAVLLMSAEVDGSDQREIYRRNKGFVTSLVLDPTGRQVAVTPFPGRHRRPRLVVVDTRDGSHEDVLRNAPRFDFVTGTGWSPNGRRLVFEGIVTEGGQRNDYLWTIKADGTDLRKKVALESVVNESRPNDVIAWTREGIYYLDGRDLLVLRGGRPKVALAQTWRIWVSGDAEELYAVRPRGRLNSVWRMRADGTGLERFAKEISPHPRLGYVLAVVPNHGGERLLTLVDTESGPRAYVHPATRMARTSDAVLDFASSYLVTWN